jgi:large subunit ribosomal protein L4
MANARLYDFNGDMMGSVDLPAYLFEAEVNNAVLYDAIRMYLANRRSGTAKTKERSEVNFGKRKPYRQKGTGRARAGKRSSPIWKGGGVVFGPHPRDYRFSIPKKVKRLALRSALSDKGRGNGVVVVEGVRLEEPKTKRFAEFLQVAGLNGKRVLVVSDAYDENLYRSARNIPGVACIVSRNMNAYEILRSDIVLFTREALSSLEEVFTQ